MFHGLQPVADHPCCQMQGIVETFFERTIDQPVFSLALFPEWLLDKPERSRNAIVRRFKPVHERLHATEDADFRKRLHAEVIQANQIEGICGGLIQVPATVLNGKAELAGAIRDLMLGLYDSLDNVVFRRPGNDQRPSHQWYREFIAQNRYLCPFCGLENYKNAVGRVRENFDHYLYKSKYPWAAVNSANLIPTCNTCNSGYKGDKDVLESGRAFYPFTNPPRIAVSVRIDSLPDPTEPKPLGNILVELACEPHDESTLTKLKTWDRVYAVRERLANEIIEHHDDWMQEVTIENPEIVNHAEFTEIIEYAREKANIMAERRLGPGQTIRAAFFGFLLEHAESDFFISFLNLHNARIAAGDYGKNAQDAEA